MHFYISERQRKLAEYYKRQERLLKGYQEVDSYTDLGMIPGNLTEVLRRKIYSFSDYLFMFIIILYTLGAVCNVLQSKLEFYLSNPHNKDFHLRVIYKSPR